ncbi:MAG: tape measure protein [Burkholderiales bacterium]
MAIAGSLEIQMFAGIARLTSDMNQAKGVVTSAGRHIEGAVSTMKTALASLGLGFGLGALITLTDQYTKFTAQLRLATSGTAAYGNAMKDVRRIATDAQSDLAATGVLYARIARGTEELRLSQRKLADITETVSLALKASGATTAEAASAMLQLSQAFGSGVLRGQEFNAVNEAAPRLMKALADGMGVAVGGLRKMAEEGKITSKVMAESLPKALEELRKEAASVQTIAGAFQVLKNNVMEFVGENAKASGSVAVISGLIGTLANNLTLLAGAVLSIAASKFVTWLTSGTVAMYASIVANRAEAAATLLSAQAKVASTGAVEFHRNARVAEAAALIASTRGMAALTLVTTALLPAQAAATRAAAAHASALTALSVAQKAASITSVAASTALGLLGGPIGWITLALGLGATAWSVWGNKADDAINKANRISGGKIGRPETWEEYTRRMAPIWAAADAAAEEAARKKSKSDLEKYLKEMEALRVKSETERLLAREQQLEDEGTLIREAFFANKKIQDDARAEGAKSDIDAWAAKWEAWQELERQIGQLRLKGIKDITKADMDAAKKAADFRKDQEKEITRGLTDALMRGFDSGKGFARNFWDSMIAMAKTVVLRPIIEGVLNSAVSGAASGAAGSSVGSSLATSAAGSYLFGSTAAAGVPVTSTVGAVASGAMYTGAGSTGLTGTATGALGAMGPVGWIALAAVAAYAIWNSNEKEEIRNPWASITTSGAGGPAGTLAITQMDLAGGDDPRQWEAINAWLDQLPDKVKLAVDNLGMVFEPGTTSGRAWAAFEAQIGVTASALGLTTEEMRHLWPIAERVAYETALVNQRHEMEIALMEASGNAAGALAAKRADELAAMDESLRPLQQAINAANDLAVAQTAAAQAQEEATRVANEAAEAANELARTNQGWQDQLDVLTGARTQQQVDRANTLAAATDATTKALIAQVFAQQDLSEAAKAVTSSVGGSGLTDQLVAAQEAWMASGKTDLTARATIYALQDQINKANAASGISAATQANSSIYTERKKLQDQLDDLTMTKIELLEKERNAIHASNRALWDQVQAATAAKEAAAAAAAAQKTYLESMVNFGKSIKDFLHSLDIGSTSTIKQQFDAAQKQYLDDLGVARSGTGKAQADAYLRLANDAQTYIDKAQQMYASGDTTQAIINQIKSELGGLDAVTKYDENLAALQTLTDAINGLNATLQVGIVPGFASGGNFGGGMRLIGEHGPELEMTGPSRIYSASQTQSMLSGAAGNDAVVKKLEGLEATVARLLERIAHGQSTHINVTAKSGEKIAKATTDAAWRQEVKPGLK